ncbi:hypothetical protein [Rhodalgimonas zhirmunskyi]|uniref:Uncharacterized protein n=1 Tax=Rhodalgimonas zhirmunskyi TaxID=2964767 RepID=A0AAJ1UCD5_9RHOB|nr:hypothetical protein [Rhodoalgimonas zhirmunskyi]MDQ2093956.1 hypothetical protein [Rhodoalgimonas zhirmunskyi]
MKTFMRSLAAFATIASLAFPTASVAQSVTVDGDGWVSVNGREIGRVYVSWGWVISCNYGYKNGGGSFKADVDNQNQAIGVLLRACKY